MDNIINSHRNESWQQLTIHDIYNRKVPLVLAHHLSTPPSAQHTPSLGYSVNRFDSEFPNPKH
jgi:hypothetical protein